MTALTKEVLAQLRTVAKPLTFGLIHALLRQVTTAVGDAPIAVAIVSQLAMSRVLERVHLDGLRVMGKTGAEAAQIEELAAELAAEIIAAGMTGKAIL